MLNSVEKWLSESHKKKKYNKKPLIREGPNLSPISELIDNLSLSKNPDVSFVVL
jgi:hypothetical protein